MSSEQMTVIEKLVASPLWAEGSPQLSANLDDVDLIYVVDQSEEDFSARLYLRTASAPIEVRGPYWFAWVNERRKDPRFLDGCHHCSIVRPDRVVWAMDSGQGRIVLTTATYVTDVDRSVLEHWVARTKAAAARHGRRQTLETDGDHIAEMARRQPGSSAPSKIGIDR